MRAVMLMFDTLERSKIPHFNKRITNMPNFERLAKRTVAFNNFYVGSLPCMPARRELHTGRYNFLHRSWSPLEPWDESVFEHLKENGVYTHLITDHQHYWEDGGSTYHNRYNSYEFVRGQEGDLWKGNLNIDMSERLKAYPHRTYPMGYHDEVNRSYMKNEEDFPQAQCFKLGLEFLEVNREQDNWFLQIETFDPHEPFYVPERFKKRISETLVNSNYDWPEGRCTEEIENKRRLKEEFEHYEALILMIDEYLGKLLDKFDELNLWDDTMLMINTDHGFMTGEKEWTGKSVMPVYNEIAHVPFFFWDPRLKMQNESVEFLGQMRDISATLIDYFNVPKLEHAQGRSLSKMITSEENRYDSVIYGYFGAHVNITDGKFTYMRGSKDASNLPLYEYTLMPMRMRRRWGTDDFLDATLVEPLSFTKGIKPMRVEAKSEFYSSFGYGNLLFNLVDDANQLENLDNDDIEAKYANMLLDMLKENEAPQSQYERLGLTHKKTNLEIRNEKNKRQDFFKNNLGKLAEKPMHESTRSFLIQEIYLKNPEVLKELEDRITEEYLTVNLIKKYLDNV